MTQREWLIDLLIDGNIDADESGAESRVERCEEVADWLIANGVVLPVRCCDCEHNKEYENYMFCEVSQRMLDDRYGYCQHGERKGGD